MVDIAIQTPPSGLDALTASRSSRGSKQDDGDRKGFLQALSGSGRDSRQSSAATNRDDSNNATSADAGTNSDASDDAQNNPSTEAGDPKTAKDKSMATDATGLPTDVKAPTVPAGLKTPPLPTSFPKSLLGLQKPVPADQVLPTDIITEVPPDTQADATAEKTLDLAQQLSSATTGDQVPDGAEAPKDANGTGKTAAKADTTDGKAVDVPLPDAGGAASDALSLLNVPLANAAPILVPTVAAALATSEAEATAEPEQEQPVSKTISGKMSNTATADIGSDAAPSASADAGTQSFKLVRANGRSGAMDMSIGKGSDDLAQLDVKTSAGGGSDTITVLDSRRFLGLADGSNGALVTGALSADKEWAAAMRTNAALASGDSASATGKVVNTLKIQMNPIDLGLVTAHMRLSGDQLTVDLKVQSAEAYRQLSSDQNKMMDALRAQGYAVDRITVSMSPAASDAGDKQNQQGFQGQQSQQQSAANQGQGSEAQARRQGYPGQQTNGNDSGRSTKDAGVDDGPTGGAQRSRAGSVYL